MSKGQVEIEFSTRLYEVNDRVIAELPRVVGLYQTRTGPPGRLVYAPTEEELFQPAVLTHSTLANVLSEYILFFQRRANGEPKFIRMPGRVAGGVLGRQKWPRVPVLETVREKLVLDRARQQSDRNAAVGRSCLGYEQFDEIRLLRPAPSPLEERINRELLVALKRYDPRRRADAVGPDRWTFLSNPVICRDESTFIPDIAGWLDVPRTRLLAGGVKEIRLRPDFVCEIASPETAALDRYVKLQAYAAARINWVWLFDPQRHTLEIFGHGEEKPKRAWHHTYRVRPEPLDGGCIDLCPIYQLVSEQADDTQDVVALAPLAPPLADVC